MDDAHDAPPAPPADALVSVVALSKRFSATMALDGLDFELRPGEVVGLLGPNGAGKTTTLKLLLGLLRPSAGRARILGLDCTSESQRVKERIGYTPDEPQFYDFLTGRETIDFVISARALDPAAAWTALEPIVRDLEFEPQLGELTASFSHGMKKKLALLCALVHRPRVLLLDEPTNGLDPPTALRVRELLRREAGAGAAVLLSTHLLDMADRLCDRMLVIHRGRKIAHGTAAEVRAQAGVPNGATLEDAFLELMVADGHGAHERSPRALRQLWLLLGLWWRHVRRRAVRVGEAPRRSGVPTFLLINPLSLIYLVPLLWRAVSTSMLGDEGFFAWHMTGVLLIGLGAGLSKGGGSLQVRGMRSDAFLEALPLTPFARLGLQLADGAFVVPFAVVVPLAGASTRGSGPGAALAAAVLGLLAYVTFFVCGQALSAWARSLGPPTTGRRCLYLGVSLNLGGLVATLLPLGQALETPGRAAGHATAAWLDGGAPLLALYGSSALLLVLAYRALVAAERAGFDQLQMAGSAPQASKGVQSRLALEWQMVLRQGGRPLVVILSLMLLGASGLLLSRLPGRLSSSTLFFVGGFAVYLGAIITVAQAGRAARSDLMARPFLAALPLSPHQVLDGKARALRRLLIPIFALLGLLAVLGAHLGVPSLIYRMTLAMVALYIAASAAVSVSFLAQGIGVVGIGGGQGSSSFSTQLLMMPLMATVLTLDNWAASVACISVTAVTWEARRAASRSVRWLDDPGDDVERETTVWRALIAATAFFTLQAMSLLLLDLFDVPTGYQLAIAFGMSAALLALLTFRNATRFEKPRFVPRSIWAWPLGAAGGGISGWLALRMAELLPKQTGALDEPFSSGEAIAIFATLVVMAPLAEEYFFRGWLQKAIENDLPEATKRWAFALGALAFALAHIGTYGVPQLVLGLLAGGLYARFGGLWPAILAHAIHNGLVLLAYRP